MNDFSDRRSPNRIKAQLEAARTAGAWMPWAGAALAVLYWGGIGIWLIASLGPALFTQSPLILAGGLAAIIAPGLALVMAGVMARESARSSEANAVVLASARMLLEPAHGARDDIASIGEAVANQTHTINKALTDTRGRLDGLKHEIEGSVTAALKAAEIVRADSEVLVHKMSSERQSMTQLAESLRNQSESLAKAIPRHAQMMSEAARAAQDQVKKADDTLTSRLRGLEETAGHLAQRIDQLDNMGAESRKRAQNLAGALMRLDEQLVQSTRMVEAATKAGQLATAATKSTAESLRDAVSDALGSALKATETINASSARASEDAHNAMVKLKDAGLQAEATTRAASLAAKTQADETEQRINQLSEFLFRAATRATNAAESGLDRARQRIERASLLVGQIRGDTPRDTPSSIDDMVLDRAPSADPALLRPRTHDAEPQAERHTAFPLHGARAPTPAAPPQPPPQHAAAPAPTPAPAHAPVAAADVDDFLLDKPVPVEPEILRPSARPTASSGFDRVIRDEAGSDELVLDHIAALRRPGHAPSPSNGASNGAAHGGGNGASPLFPPEPRPAHLDPLFPSESQRNNINSWRDLLTNIEDVPERARDQSASGMLGRLDRAGVRLDVVKASDLRRIASAAHQGERQRRRAIRDVAPGEIQRVARLLDADRELHTAARTFITAEEPDALRVLAVSDRAREDAHPRLSAYLLLDAALGATI